MKARVCAFSPRIDWRALGNNSKARLFLWTPFAFVTPAFCSVTSLKITFDGATGGYVLHKRYSHRGRTRSTWISDWWGRRKMARGEKRDQRRIEKLIERFTRRVKRPNLEGKTGRNRARGGPLSASANTVGKWEVWPYITASSTWRIWETARGRRCAILWNSHPRRALVCSTRSFLSKDSRPAGEDTTGCMRLNDSVSL